jgi:phosphonate transport system ATP-binding protein
MIFQQHQLIRRHTVLQNVLMGRLGGYTTLRSLFPLPKKEQLIAMESIERVGLIDKTMERVDSLSGGQQQRVGIARALTQKPRLILADEPVASLDPATAHNVLSLLHTICKEDGITVVASLHHVALAQTYADRLIGLSDGRVVFDSRPADLTTEILDGIYHNHKPRSGKPAGLSASVSSNILHKLVTIEQ